jgi:DNA-binding PadR family transcriptional regulator
MIEQELLFLGLLKQSPKHGYEIKKQIKEILEVFSGLELKSIYYPLQILEKKKLILKHVNKEGNRPKRFVYSLTSKGQARFEQLLAKSFLDFKRPEFSLDISLYFLPFIKPQIARRRLKARMQILKKLTRSLKTAHDSMISKKPPSLAYILEHDLEMVESELNFLSRLTKNI